MLSPVLTVSIFQKQPDPQAFSAGEVIFEEGQSGDKIYGILEGEVDILVNGKVVETIETGEVFGVGILVGVKNRTYTAIAKVDTKLAFLNHEGVSLCCSRNTYVCPTGDEKLLRASEPLAASALNLASKIATNFTFSPEGHT